MYFTLTNNQNIDPQKQHNILQQLVTIYNHTFHTSINMAPVEMTYEEEYKYIARKQNELKLVITRQQKAGLFNFKQGDKIKIYIDKSKTKDGFDKKRGNFVYDATFIDYVNRNARVKINNGKKEEIITIPLYWIRV